MRPAEQGRQRNGWSGGGRRWAVALVAAGVVVIGAVASAGAAGPAATGGGGSLGAYKTHNLVSDQAGKADVQDKSLVNGWGLSLGPGTFGWVADNVTSVSTLYGGDVAGSPVKKIPLTVAIPGGPPTGTVFNGSNGFVVKSGGKQGPAEFLFSSMGGQITAWSQAVPPLTTAHTVAKARRADFTGLAIANTSKGPRLYAPDFHKRKVDVWNGAFKRVQQKGAFRDPKLPSSYAPFGIDTVQGHVFVTYAKQDSYGVVDVAGPGHGFVDVFSKRGKLLQRFASHGALNSPWGIALAPKGFGGASGDVLIGNFGDGHIDAYRPKSGKFVGPLQNAQGHKLTIDWLWSLEFGNGVIGTPKTLLFTAGPNSESHGLFGDITPG